MTRQAIQLGWLPRLQITQTSEKGYGQIYVGVINWLLMIVTVCLTCSFGKSDNLAAAYGIAVSATMLMTSALLLSSPCVKFGDGPCRKWLDRRRLPLCRCQLLPRESREGRRRRLCSVLLASIVYGVMLIWHRGSTTVAQVLSERAIPVNQFMNSVELREIRGFPNSGFPHQDLSDTPPVVIWHVKHNKSLHNHLSFSGL